MSWIEVPLQLRLVHVLCCHLAEMPSGLKLELRRHLAVMEPFFFCGLLQVKDAGEISRTFILLNKPHDYHNLLLRAIPVFDVTSARLAAISGSIRIYTCTCNSPNTYLISLETLISGSRMPKAFHLLHLPLVKEIYWFEII